jgi:hypothetical protein
MLDFTEEKNSKQELERNEVVTELDADAQLKLEVIQTLLEPCDLRSRYLWQKVKGGKRISPKQVFLRTKVQARELDVKAPSPMRSGIL